MSSIWTIRRSATDVKLTGLCGGLAEHWRVDPVLVRLGCVLLVLSGGIGVVLYLAGWLLIPVQGRDRAPVDDLSGTRPPWRKEVWVAIVALACLLTLGVFGSLSPFGIAPAVVLAVVWYFGFHRRQPESAEPPAPPAALPPVGQPQAFYTYPGPPTPFTRPFSEAAESWRARVEAARQPPPTTSAPVAAAWPAPPPSNISAEPDLEAAGRAAFWAEPDPVGLYGEPEPTPTVRAPRRSARRLQLVCLIVLGLVLGALALLDGHGVDVPPVGYAGAALLVVGLSLVAGAWFGRPGGLVPIGLLLLATLLVTSVGPPLNRGEWQTATVTHTRVSELSAAGDSKEAGRLTVDLTSLQLGADATYRAHVGTGSLSVTVPDNVNVVLDYDVDLGVVEVLDTEVAGGASLTGTVAEPTVADPTRPTLTLDLSVDQGEVRVQR